MLHNLAFRLAWVILGLFHAACAEQDDVEDTCGPDGATSSTCLLQNTLLQESLGGIAKVRTERVSRHSYEEVSLFELGSSVDSRVEVVSSMLSKSQVRCKQVQAHQFLLSRHTQGLENHLLMLAEAFASKRPTAKTRGKPVAKVVPTAKPSEKFAEQAAETEEADNVDNDAPPASLGESADPDHPVALSEESDAEVTEQQGKPIKDPAPPKKEDAEAFKTKEAEDLSKLVDEFIESQSGSEDACSSKLFEARHQLNQLQDILTTLLTQVNTTENSLILYDKSLQEKLRELQEIEMWKAGELQKCKAKKEADQKMLITLTAELKEMHQIASPATAMNIANNTISEQASQTKLSFLQERAESMNQKLSLLQEDVSRQDPHEAAVKVPGLVQTTHDAAREFLACVEPKPSSLLQAVDAQDRRSVLQELGAQDPKKTVKKVGKPKDPDNLKKDETYETSQGNASSSEFCQEQKEKLETTYVKAYVELSRLVAEYTGLVKSTACEDAVMSEYEERAPPLQDSAEKLSKLSSETAEDLKELRPRLEQTVEADKKLRKQVIELTAECENLPETISDLDKVRDAIQALKLCPGLGRPDFKLPHWTGKWVDFSQDASRQDDKQQDAGMNWACNHAEAGTRAAESSEIMERTILDMPTNNSGLFPLMGGCPNCAGDDDKDLKSGHGRICWFKGQPLNEQGFRGDCVTGRKVIMCVTDAVSIRKIAGEQ